MTQILNDWILSDDAAKSMLYQILLYNSRALLLLLCCFIFIRLFKVSASSRHFLITITIGSIILIPLFSKLIPAIDIIIDTNQPVFLEALTNTTAEKLEAGYTRVVPTAHYSSTLLLMYLAISTLLILKIALDNFKMLALLKLSRPVNQCYWQNALRQHSQTLGIKRQVTIVHSSLITSPSTWGAMQPVIFIPSHAIQWPDHLITSTLLHELAHIKRFDWLTQQLAKCICAAYWINPVCWKAFKNLSSNAETACDDIAIIAGLHKTRYANDLLHVAEHVYQHTNYNYAALNMARANGTNQLSDRVLAILSPEALHTPISRHNAFIIFFAIVCLVLPLTSLRANFIERVHISLPAITTEPFKTTAIKTQHLLIPKLQEDDTFNEQETLPVVIANELPELTQQTSLTPIGNNNSIIESPKPIVITHLQSISTSEIIEKIADQFINKPVKNATKQSKPYVEQNIPITLHVDNFNENIATLTTDITKLKHSKDLATTGSLASSFAALNIPNIQLHEEAVVKNLVIPKYPRRALLRGIEGEVTVEYSLDKFGKIINTKIVSTGPTKIFNYSALKALKKSTFSPRTLNGQPVATSGLQEKYVFVLES